MTRASDLAKIITDANLAGTVDVAGAFTSQGIDDNADATAITIDSSENVTFASNITAEGGDYLFRNSSGNSIISIIGNASNSSILKLGDTADFDIGQIEYNHGSNYLAIKTNDSERMRITSSGNVGIGTSSPSSYYSTELVISTSDNGGITLANTNTSHASYIMFADGTSGSDQYRGQFGYDHNINAMVFHTDVTERMRIDSSGRVGIATNSPANTLHIIGTSATPSLRLGSSSLTHYWDIGRENATTGDFIFSQSIAGSVSERMRIDSSGNVLHTIASQGNAFVPNTSSTWNALEIFQDRGVTNSASGIAFRSQSGTAPAGIVSVALNTTGGREELAFLTSTGNATSERMRINESGNVGIGTSSPTQALVVSESSTPTIQIKDGLASGTRVSGRLHIGESDTLGVSIENSTNTYNDNCAMVFKTSPAAGTITERMRIASSGDILIGTTSFASGSKGKQFEINNNAISFRSGSAVTTTSFHEEFHNANGMVGSITTSGSGTNFNASSDYRLKENVTYTFDATSRLKQLKPSRFNFIADANTTVDGFLAHEVSSIVPEAVTGEKDAVDSDGNIVPQSIDQSKLVPLLVKTIQELEARITALEGA